MLLVDCSRLLSVVSQTVQRMLSRLTNPFETPLSKLASLARSPEPVANHDFGDNSILRGV